MRFFWWLRNNQRRSLYNGKRAQLRISAPVRNLSNTEQFDNYRAHSVSTTDPLGHFIVLPYRFDFYSFRQEIVPATSRPSAISFLRPWYFRAAPPIFNIYSAFTARLFL